MKHDDQNPDRQDGSQPRDGPTGPSGPHSDGFSRADRVREGIERRKAATSFASLEALVAQEEAPRNLFRAITRPGTGGKSAIIIELSRNMDSSSINLIAGGFYGTGATALLCHTDDTPGDEERNARAEHFRVVRAASRLPCIRDDLLIDPWQLWESRALGADAVVLHADDLLEAELIDLLILAQQLNLTSIIQARTMDGVLRVRPHVGFPHCAYSLLCIQNHDTETGHGGIDGTLRMLDMADDPGVVISRGGIRSAADLKRLRAAGVRIAIVDADVLKEQGTRLFEESAHD